jgi:hypothetical protein
MPPVAADGWRAIRGVLGRIRNERSLACTENEIKKFAVAANGGKKA